MALHCTQKLALEKILGLHYRGFEILSGVFTQGCEISPSKNSQSSMWVEKVPLGRDGPEYPTVTLGSTRSYLRANEEVARRVIRSYAEAVHLLKTNKAVAVRVIQKYARVKEPEILEGTYTESRDYLESVPYVSRKGLEIILAELGESDPKARQAKVDDFLDMRFVAELERDGFFSKLRDN